MLHYTKLKNCDTGFQGVFNIFVNSDKNIIYKKVKNNINGKELTKLLKNINNYNKYKKIITTLKKNPIIGNNTIKGFDVEADGSYKCKYVNGYRLDKILKEEIIINDISVINKIIFQIKKLKKILNQNHANIGGDWALHNLLYDINNETITNIDLEGFYTNLTLPEWGNIDKINKFLESVLFKIEKNKKYIDNRNHRQSLLVLPFLNNFFKCNNFSIDLQKSIIGTTFNNIPSNIYIAIEAHDKKNINTDMYIMVANNKNINITSKYSYHITWAAISFYLRNCNYNILSSPLKNIYNKKSKFCSYMFRNKTYKNAIKRYNFFKILNSKQKVDNITNDKRFSIEMYNDVVEEYKPYRFSIAFENDIVDGYITEKIINSFLAGCIPIYDGPNDIYEYFNKDSFINAKDFNSLEELANYVIKVDNTPEIMNKYLNNFPSDIEKLKKLFWWEFI